MAFLKNKVSKEELSVEKSGGGNYIGQSGVYDVVVKALVVDINDKGARTISPFVEYNGQEQTLYGALPLDLWDNSKVLDGAEETLAGMYIIAGLDPEDIEEPIETELPIGKAGAMKDVTVLQEIEDVPMKFRIQMEYYKSSTGEIKEKAVLKDVFSTDGKSVAEILDEELEPGSRLAKLEPYLDKIKVSKDLTEEEVKAWIANGRKSGNDSSTTAAKKRPSFGSKKPKFGSKE